jgi:hypothetical protein
MGGEGELVSFDHIPHFICRVSCEARSDHPEGRNTAQNKKQTCEWQDEMVRVHRPLPSLPPSCSVARCW